MPENPYVLMINIYDQKNISTPWAKQRAASPLLSSFGTSYAAAACSTLFSYPLDLIKTRIQLAPINILSNKSQFRSVAELTHRLHGYRGFYHG